MRARRGVLLALIAFATSIGCKQVLGLTEDTVVSGGDAGTEADTSAGTEAGADAGSSLDVGSPSDTGSSADSISGPEVGPDTGEDGEAGSSVCGGPFPSTPIFDPLTTNGPLGSSFIVQNPSAYAVQNMQIVATGQQLSEPGTISWNAALGATQEVYVTVAQFEEIGQEEIELVLKGLQPGVEQRAIFVDYRAITGPLGIYVGYGDGSAFHDVGSNLSVVLHPGDELGARACPDGAVQIYVNRHLLDTFDASAFQGAKGGGFAGFYSSSVTLPFALSGFGGG